MYRAGVAWQKQADTAEYDQSAAAQAIAAYTDFTVVFPDDRRVAAAEAAKTKLKAEQVRGSFEIARFYEFNHKWAGAIIYYNDVLQLDANSPLAAQARQRIEILKPRLSAAPQK
jgi:outer membrane protein assembly factor BamD (BamD/ComL family)